MPSLTLSGRSPARAGNAILMAVVGFNLLGDGINDLLDLER